MKYFVGRFALAPKSIGIKPPNIASCDPFTRNRVKQGMGSEGKDTGSPEL